MDTVIKNGYLYWTAHASDVGLIERCPLGDCLGNEETMADMQNRPWGIAADDDRIYWVTEDGTINYVAQ